MATRTLAGDMETIGPTETLVVSPLNVGVSVILPVIVDTLSHGYKPSSSNKHGVLDGHSLTIQATGAGNINVLDSHQIWWTIVYAVRRRRSPLRATRSATAGKCRSQSHRAGR